MYFFVFQDQLQHLLLWLLWLWGLWWKAQRKESIRRHWSEPLLTQRKTLSCSTLSTFSTYYGGEPFHNWVLYQAAWHAMRTKLGISPENIILYGQSIGTVPTVDLASRFEVSLHLSNLQSSLVVWSQVAFGILRWGRWSFIVHWCPGCV